MLCQVLACLPLPHAICSKPVATSTGLLYVVRRRRTAARFTGPSEVLIITQFHLNCVVKAEEQVSPRSKNMKSKSLLIIILMTVVPILASPPTKSGAHSAPSNAPAAADSLLPDPGPTHQPAPPRSPGPPDVLQEN